MDIAERIRQIKDRKLVAMQKLRAAILSDGNLCLLGDGTATFHLGLSDSKDNFVQRERIPIEELLAFLERFTEEALVPLGVEPCTGHPKVHLKTQGNKKISEVILETRTSGLLRELCHEYYPHGKKVVPENFNLTSLFLAYFFMFDGISHWNSCGGPTVDVYLCTHCFDLHSKDIFEGQLYNFGISNTRVKSGTSIMTHILQDSVDHFMSIVDPYVIPPYRYKIKYRGSCPPELNEKYRNHYNSLQRRRRSKK